MAVLIKALLPFAIQIGLQIKSSIHKSQTGYFFQLAGASISWQSHAQKTIALSSTKAEYMALCDCCKQAKWIKTLLSKLGINVRPVPINGDNQGSIFLGSNPVQGN